MEAKARTRRRLLDAAAGIFAEHGFSGASVDEIAARAGYTIGALYTHFSGKEELFLSLLEEHVSHRLRDAERIAGDGPDSFAAFGEFLADVADEHVPWSLLELEFLRYALPRPEVLARLAERWRIPRTAIARLAGGSEEVGTVILALFHGLVLQRRIDRAAVPSTLFADALDWLSKGIDAP
ncbi:TetR/AcrR family transcriptional regulator [Streptosporangiaceae bacterium NEAU-GS5]|nr:TetR/AcrR family transcriptional regulator [Streptosporangiaceae bacterium NEAU-GS5]